MWAWFIYRMRVIAPQDVISAIAKNAEQIRRPNSGHAYFHTVVRAAESLIRLAADSNIFRFLLICVTLVVFLGDK